MTTARLALVVDAKQESRRQRCESFTEAQLLETRERFRAALEEAIEKLSTFGFGVDMDRWVGQAITFDFASVPQARGLPKVSRLSLGYRF